MFVLVVVCVSASGMEAQALVPDGCQDTGWAHYPDIIKGLKWKLLGDYSICFSTTCVTLILSHYCDSVMYIEGSNMCAVELQLGLSVASRNAQRNK